MDYRNKQAYRLQKDLNTDKKQTDRNHRDLVRQ